MSVLMHRTVGCLLALSLVAVAGGCGGRGVDLVPVSGVVTHEGKLPPGPGTLYFTPVNIEPGQPRRPAIARFDEAGKFTVGSFEQEDGLVPGTYYVAVDCWQVPPTIDGPAAKSFIDPKYAAASTSGIQLEVKSDANAVTFNLDLAK